MTKSPSICHRLFPALIAIAVALMIAPASASSAKTKKSHVRVYLKTDIVVDATVVRLGDIFEVPGNAAEEDIDASLHVSVIKAPAPGKKLLLTPSSIRRIARANRLNWPNTERVDRVIVRRASRIVPQTTIEASLKQAIIDRGIEGPISIKISNKRQQIHVTPDAPSLVGIENLDVDEQTRRFSGTVRVPSGDPNGTAVSVNGRFARIVDLPVLDRQIRPGDEIKESDLRWIEVAAEKLTQNLVISPAELIGKTPKRRIRPGYPVRVYDVRDPIVIEKGETVRMIFEANGINLSAVGRALEPGAKNQMIRILNTASKRTIEALVTSSGQVLVSTPPIRTANR